MTFSALDDDVPKKKKKKHRHKEHKSLRRSNTFDRQDSEVYTNVHLHTVIDGILDRSVVGHR